MDSVAPDQRDMLVDELVQTCIAYFRRICDQSVVVRRFVKLYLGDDSLEISLIAATELEDSSLSIRVGGISPRLGHVGGTLK